MHISFITKYYVLQMRNKNILICESLLVNKLSHTYQHSETEEHLEQITILPAHSLGWQEGTERGREIPSCTVLWLCDAEKQNIIKFILISVMLPLIKDDLQSVLCSLGIPMVVSVNGMSMDAYKIFRNDICFKWRFYSKSFIDLSHSVSSKVNKAKNISICGKWKVI